MSDIWQFWDGIRSAAQAEQRRPLVVEIGVCDGDDSRRFLDGDVDWIGFEPHPVSAALCRERQNFSVIEAAVSDQDGEADFHLSSGNTPGFVEREHRDSSSLQVPTLHRAWHPWCKFETTTRVRTVRLDSVVPADRVVDLIWADVQGAQRKVIAGASRTLRRTRWLYIECPPEPLYDGETTFAELCGLLPGWTVVERWANDVLFRNATFEQSRRNDVRISMSAAAAGSPLPRARRLLSPGTPGEGLGVREATVAHGAAWSFCTDAEPPHPQPLSPEYGGEGSSLEPTPSRQVAEAISPRGYWRGDARNEHCFDGRLAAELARFFAGKTVVDFGCGPGDYVRFLADQSVRIDGYDGNPHTPACNPACKVLDLSAPVSAGSFDWVLSLEVGEHIPEQYEATFLDNLHRHNREGVVLSWAVTGQGGHGHVNERDNAYIKRIFEFLGYTNDVQHEQRLRAASSLPWFGQTLMVFRRKTPLAHADPAGSSLPLVSCLCPTYNRAPGSLRLVEEAVESFLRQDYPYKELVVLNDTPGQKLRCDDPQVRVVNTPFRCASLGEKRNLLAGLARGDLLCVWDDDDISLPWRLSTSVRKLGEAEYYNAGTYWFLDGDGLHGDHPMGTGYFTSIYRKIAYQELGGTPNMSMGEDFAMDEKLRTRQVANSTRLPRDAWYYIYRWGSSPCHLSSVQGDRYYAALGELPIARGEFVLRPHWEQDYVALTRAHSATCRSNPAAA